MHIFIHISIADLIDPSLFLNARKKRQTTDPTSECTSFETCAGSSFTGPEFEDLTFTDEQRRLCNNDEACLYDFAITNDEEVADISRESSEASAQIQQIISELRKINFR